MSRKYILLQLTASELDAIDRSDLSIGRFAEYAIDRWQDLAPFDRDRLLQERIAARSQLPLVQHNLVASQKIKDWLKHEAIDNNSLYLSCAIATAIPNYPYPLFILPYELSQQLHRRGISIDAICEIISINLFDL